MQVKNAEIDSITPYQTPSPSALFKGRAVRLLAVANAKGHSPVIQYVDQDGSISWAEESDFTIFDTNYLPCAVAALSDAVRSLKQ